MSALKRDDLKKTAQLYKKCEIFYFNLLIQKMFRSKQHAYLKIRAPDVAPHLLLVLWDQTPNHRLLTLN